MKKKENIRTIFLIVFSFVMGGIIMFALLKWTPLVSEVLGTNGNTIITKNGTQVYEKNSLAAAVDKIYDAVAMVSSYQNNTLISTGSAFVYKTDDNYGYLLTNHHVVDGADKVTVTMSDDKEAEATVLGGDEYLDLAVLRIDKSNVSMVANIGTSEDMKLGDTIFTVGTPMGEEYRGTVTSGILSGKDRMVSVSTSNNTFEDYTEYSNDWVMRVLQFDASINPGNSGGPLLNVNGEVIGICSLKLASEEVEGMGFAIPIEYAMNHIETLEKGEAISWPVLGVSMVNASDSAGLYRNRIMIDRNITEGVVVVQAEKGSGAYDAGLTTGDVITKIDGKEVKDSAYLRYELYQHQAGDTIKVTYIRDGKEHTVDVKLSASE